MNTTKFVVVCGIDGRQGSSVAHAFLKEPVGLKVRGLTCNSAPPMMQQWEAHGVEILQVDPNDEDALRVAFEGAEIIFGVTDFWSHIADHSTESLTYMTGKPHVEIAYHCEFRQGMTMIRAASTVRNLQRLILSTLPSARNNSGGEMTGVYHFDAKADTVAYLEEHFPDLSSKTSLVQTGFHMGEYRMLVYRNEDGTYTMGTGMPAHVPLPWINMWDLGRMVRALLLLPPKQNFKAATQECTLNEICRMFQDVSGESLAYRRLTAGALEKRLPRTGQLFKNQCTYIEEYGYYGPEEESMLDPDELARRTNVRIRVTTFEDFLKADLPTFLQRAMQTSLGSSGVYVFPSHSRSGSADAMATSAAMSAQNNVVPSPGGS